MTVNRYCGSGLSAASIVANRIAAGEATIAIAAGVESISLVQFNLNIWPSIVKIPQEHCFLCP